jgi:hypothetical protein
MNWCGSKKLKNVSESVILAYLEYKAKKLRNCDLFFNQKLLNVKVFFVLDCTGWGIVYAHPRNRDF